MGSENEKKKKVRKTHCKGCGICLQMLICFFNGLIWIISTALICLGLVLGIYSKTLGIGEHFDYIDWIITTPATIFIYYGILLFVVGLNGCFASISGNCCCVFFYVLLIGGFVAFDVLLGVGLAITYPSLVSFNFNFSRNFYDSFLDNMVESQNGYDDKNAKSYGVIPFLPTHPKFFWDHFHTKGVCCGLRKYTEWMNTPYGTKTKHIPESCCHSTYEYFGCGDLLWEHQELDWHNRGSVINQDGCLTKFPKMMQSDPHRYIDLTGKGILAALLFCFLLSFVLLLLVICRAFRPSHGLTNPEFLNVPNKLVCKCTTGRYYPKATRGSDANTSQVKAVSFDEKGPSFLPPPPASR